MKIVIDIDDKLYNRIKYLEPHTNTMLDVLMRSVQKGTPLSKGHGKIGDLDKLDNRLKRMQGRHADPLDVTGNAIACGIALARSMVDNAPTIIKADNGKENRK